MFLDLSQAAVYIPLYFTVYSKLMIIYYIYLCKNNNIRSVDEDFCK